MKLNSLSIVIPAYRDEDTISDVVKEADKVARDIALKHEIVVINDNSPDGTGEILEHLKRKVKNLRVLHHGENKGYGGTIRDLYYEAKYEWIFSVPGDNQIPVGEVKKLLPATNRADMILGKRVNRQDPPARLRQSKIYNTLVGFLFHIPISDVNSVRLMKRKILEKVTLTTASAFVDAELVIRALWTDFSVVEVPINHKARGDESGAGGGSLRTIMPTIVDMMKFRMKTLWER